MNNSHRIRAGAWLAAALMIGIASPAAGQQATDPGLAALLAEAVERNPDLLAARREADTARNRVAPAGALDDPMLEVGLLNVPVPSLSLQREDMTMKMIGITQRLPYPGKRDARREVAKKEAEVAESNLLEMANRVRRDVKMAYYDLALADETLRLTQRNRQLLEQLLSIAEARYGVGQSSQADVLKAQTQVSRMLEELIKLGRERPIMDFELNRLIGRGANPQPINPRLPPVRDANLQLENLRAAARTHRPQLHTQQRMVDRNAKALEVARMDYYPDFDLRFSYGQRDNYMDMQREDMISLTVAINLPIWRGSKREPRVAEAESMAAQAGAMYDARLNEIDAMLRQQVTAAEQTRKSLQLYESALLPQARLTAEASLAAYRVGRVDFFTLLDSRMTAFNAEIAYAAGLTAFGKALAEIEFITGTTPF